MKVIITGSQSINDKAIVFTAIKDAKAGGLVVSHILSGGKRGVESIASAMAARAGLPVEVVPADWSSNPDRGWMIRDSIRVEQADGVIAVWDGCSPGTAYILTLALQKGIPIFVLVANGQVPPFVVSPEALKDVLTALSVFGPCAVLGSMGPITDEDRACLKGGGSAAGTSAGGKPSTSQQQQSRPAEQRVPRHQEGAVTGDQGQQPVQVSLFDA